MRDLISVRWALSVYQANVVPSNFKASWGGGGEKATSNLHSCHQMAAQSKDRDSCLRFKWILNINHKGDSLLHPFNLLVNQLNFGLRIYFAVHAGWSSPYRLGWPGTYLSLPASAS